MKKEEKKDWRNPKALLCKQKYPNGLVAKAIRKAKQIPVSELRKVNKERTPGKQFHRDPICCNP